MKMVSRQAFWAYGIGAALACGVFSAAMAAPGAPLGAGVRAPDAGVMQVASRKKYRHRRHHVTGGGSYEFDRGWRGRYHDNVGSLGQDGYGYGYNRFSGQRYQSCVTDEGYGRTRPCDAGGGGGGGRN